MLDFKYSFDFVPVSTEFIENYMTEANGAYVKVYLYILYMAVEGRSAEVSIIARTLNLLEGDVVNAVEYWREKGLLPRDGGTITSRPRAEAARNAAPPSDDNPVYAEKKPLSQINDKIIHDPQLAELCAIAQEMLGRMLNVRETETLYWFYDSLELPTEVITMLLEYCVSKDKRDMNYIEKVAISWHKHGIRTIRAAEEFISAEQESASYFGELKRLLGINSRPLSKKEEDFLKKWRDDFGMSKEMVALAYEYCIIRTGKLSFPYMNSIIKNWAAKNIRTIEEAERGNEEFKNKSKKFTERDSEVYSGKGTDYAELERRMNEKYE